MIGDRHDDFLAARSPVRGLDSSALRDLSGADAVRALRRGYRRSGSDAGRLDDSRDRSGHRRGDARAGAGAACGYVHRCHGSESGDARPSGGGRYVASRPVAPGGCDEAPVSRRRFRHRRLPVRRHVLPRQGQGVLRGSPRARAGRRLRLQRVGSAGRERVRRRRDDRAGVGVPCRSASLHGADPARISRRAHRRARSRGRGFQQPAPGLHDRGAQPGRIRANRCDRVLPGHAAAKRDRVARQRAPRRGDGRGRGRPHAPVWRRRHRRPDASARIDSQPRARRQTPPRCCPHQAHPGNGGVFLLPVGNALAAET